MDHPSDSSIAPCGSSPAETDPARATRAPHEPPYGSSSGHPTDGDKAAPATPDSRAAPATESSSRIPTPYVLFLGDAHDQGATKTAAGVAHWRREWCVGQIRLPGCRADVGLPEVGLEEAVEAGARTLVVGVANRGGVVPPAWEDLLVRASALGLDLASGLHTPLDRLPTVRSGAEAAGSRIFELRRPPADLPVGDGRPRSGRRLLTVGTDCSVGKMFTSLALEREMRRRGMDATFRATGQTGILIAGEGIPIDAVVADFISGAAEVLSPAAADGHWDVIEGQGSLAHPSYAGVTLGLLHGSQPDAMVLCLDPARPHLRGVPHLPSPDPVECVALYEEHARRTNPEARVVGLAANTAGLRAGEAARALAELAARTGLPAVDPVRTGVDPLVDELPE